MKILLCLLGHWRTPIAVGFLPFSVLLSVLAGVSKRDLADTYELIWLLLATGMLFLWVVMEGAAVQEAEWSVTWPLSYRRRMLFRSLTHWLLLLTPLLCFVAPLWFLGKTTRTEVLIPLVGYLLAVSLFSCLRFLLWKRVRRPSLRFHMTNGAVFVGLVVAGFFAGSIPGDVVGTFQVALVLLILAVSACVWTYRQMPLSREPPSVGAAPASGIDGKGLRANKGESMPNLVGPLRRSFPIFFFLMRQPGILLYLSIFALGTVGVSLFEGPKGFDITFIQFLWSVQVLAFLSLESIPTFACLPLTKSQWFHALLGVFAVGDGVALLLGFLLRPTEDYVKLIAEVQINAVIAMLGFLEAFVPNQPPAVGDRFGAGDCGGFLRAACYARSSAKVPSLPSSPLCCGSIGLSGRRCFRSNNCGWSQVWV